MFFSLESSFINDKKKQTNRQQTIFLDSQKRLSRKGQHVILFKYDYRSSLTTVIIKTSLMT